VSSQYFRFVARAAEPRRSALLEQLLARADTWRPVSDWRAEAFQVIAPQAAVMPAIASAALCADAAAAAHADAAEAAWVCLATPVHYLAEMTTVRLSRRMPRRSRWTSIECGMARVFG